MLGVLLVVHGDCVYVFMIDGVVCVVRVLCILVFDCRWRGDPLDFSLFYSWTCTFRTSLDDYETSGSLVATVLWSATSGQQVGENMLVCARGGDRTGTKVQNICIFEENKVLPLRSLSPLSSCYIERTSYFGLEAHFLFPLNPAATFFFFSLHWILSSAPLAPILHFY
ncbi:unnamed protein product [Ectocarpus sp. 8 AP-2014]